MGMQSVVTLVEPGPRALGAMAVLSARAMVPGGHSRTALLDGVAEPEPCTLPEADAPEPPPVAPLVGAPLVEEPLVEEPLLLCANAAPDANAAANAMTTKLRMNPLPRESDLPAERRQRPQRSMTTVSNRQHNAPRKSGRILAALAILGVVGVSLAACKTGTPPAARPFYTPGG
jgi:hypothetical protein